MPPTDIEDMAGGGSAGARVKGGLNILGVRARVTKRVPNSNSPFGVTVNSGKENTENLAVEGGHTGGSSGVVSSGDVDDGAEGGDADEAVAPIRREDDFQGWLAQQKAGWRKHREQSQLKKRSDTRSKVSFLAHAVTRPSLLFYVFFLNRSN